MEDAQDALNAIGSMIERSEKAQVKFAEGTSQHTLQRNRIKALRIAAALIRGDADEYTHAELEQAVSPIASLISKSEKAQQKVPEGSWQHTMLEGNLRALRIAAPLLAKAIEEPQA